jgi:hypothetical protein
MDIDTLQQAYGVMSDLESGETPNQADYSLVPLDDLQEFVNEVIEEYGDLFSNYIFKLEDTAAEMLERKNFDWLRQLVEKVLKQKQQLEGPSPGDILQYELF